MDTFETSSEQIKRNDHASIDVENLHFSLANSMRMELENLHPLSDQCCIYRVPIGLRELHEKAYTPKVVSIGPLHHGREELKAMEEHKRRYLQDFLQRTKVSLEDFVKLIKEKEARLRNCYAESIGFDSDKFVKMILVDAVFIIEVLMRDSFCELQTRNERIYGKQRMINDIGIDMCLLENQLPFFILEEVFKVANINIAMSFSLVKLAHNFLKPFCLSVTDDILGNNSSPTGEHLVDLLRICHQPSTERTKREFKTLTMPTVKELHQAGVRFKLVSSKSLFDIRFNDGNGILEIPKLKIQDLTEIILKNLLAFETCHVLPKFITYYAVFFNQLVNAPKDVELLVQNGIIENWMGKSEDVSTLFQKLFNEASFNPQHFYFTALMGDLNLYYRSPWHKWKATLKQDYFNTPWAAISVIAAVVLLILTFIQAVCSIVSV